jgi:hypothetical protein
MFADITGDGLADYLWISPNGEVTAYKNGGPGASSGQWNWAPLGVISNGLPSNTRESIRFADMDGDGRADFLILGDAGSTTAYLNYGYGDRPTWRSMGIIAEYRPFSLSLKT